MLLVLHFFFLKNKSDVSFVPRFFAMVKTQFGADIKIFHFDNAKELAFTNKCNEKRVLHELSCVVLSH